MRLIFLSISMVLMGYPKTSEVDKKWVIDSSSRLLIHGNTNVNSFTCRMDNYDSYDTLEYTLDNKSNDITFSKNVMTIPVQYFDCGNDLITKDFLETLNVKEFPDMKIRFLSLIDFHAPSVDTPVWGKVAILLAGVEKTLDVKYEARANSSNLIILRGSQVVRFSDFHLKPPRKVFGMIQVQENLEVEFNLRLRTIGV